MICFSQIPGSPIHALRYIRALKQIGGFDRISCPQHSTISHDLESSDEIGNNGER